MLNKPTKKLYAVRVYDKYKGLHANLRIYGTSIAQVKKDAQKHYRKPYKVRVTFLGYL